MCKRKTKGSSTPIGLPGGGGTLNKCLYGEAPPEGSTPYIPFFTKKVPLSYTFY